MKGAACCLRDAAIAALAEIDGLAIYDGRPIRASTPYALVEIGPEADWGHKSAAGRELRIAASVIERGERAERLPALMDRAEAALAGLGGTIGGWRLVTMAFARRQTVPPRAGGVGSDDPWTGIVEFRARMLAL